MITSACHQILFWGEGHNIIGTSFLLFSTNDIFLSHDTLDFVAWLNHFRMILRKVPPGLAKRKCGHSNVRDAEVLLMITWVFECVWGRVGGPKESHPPAQVSDREWTHLLFSINLCREIQAYIGRPQARPKGYLLFIIWSTLTTLSGHALFQACVLWTKGVVQRRIFSPLSERRKQGPEEDLVLVAFTPSLSRQLA